MSKSPSYSELMESYERVMNYLVKNREKLEKMYGHHNLAFVCNSSRVRVFDFDKDVDRLAKRINESGINQSNLVVMGTLDNLLDNTPKIFSMS